MASSNNSRFLYVREGGKVKVAGFHIKPNRSLVSSGAPVVWRWVLTVSPTGKDDRGSANDDERDDIRHEN
jgi:hypothetical protein